jgi:hypothetical protein
VLERFIKLKLEGSGMNNPVNTLSVLVAAFLSEYRERELWALPHRRDFEGYLCQHLHLSPGESAGAVDELVLQRFLYVDSGGSIFLVDSAPEKHFV